jgi:hypothetical protein
MFDIDNNTEPNLQRLVNLYSFLVIFLLQENVKNTHPSYLIEKWNHWIGTEVKLKQNVLQPGDIVAFADYRKTWCLRTDEEILAVREIFYFIYCIDRCDLRNWIQWLNYFGGDLTKISSEKKVGLHFLAHQKVKSLMEEESDVVTAFLRDMKLSEIGI